MLQSQIVTSPLPFDVRDGRSMTLFDACNNRKMGGQRTTVKDDEATNASRALPCLTGPDLSD